MKPTMAAVARELGVHQTTVSLALRGHPSIPPATRERVRIHAEKMGYRPNPLVSALMATRRSGRVRSLHSRLALLTTGTARGVWMQGSPNYRRLHTAIIDRAASRGYGLEDFWLDDPAISPSRLRRILLQRGIRGLIVTPLNGERHEINFDFSDFATVALRYSLQNPPLDRVSIDYAAAMQLALQMLRESGCRRIAFASTQAIDRKVNHLSLGVYLAARFSHPRLFPEPGVRARWTRETIRAWFSSSRADAVILPTVDILEIFKKALPKTPLYTLNCHVDSTEPGVMQDVEAEARAAVDLLTGRVERAEFGLPGRPQTILISGNWRPPLR